ncbi:hypothetical protein PPYR_14950 [Photinus pyralis]|uniref:UDP-glucuronosyltransferase n=1 Tax=Photinus pyralis TaxID=7054 RepID=A0A1Y1N7J5_PHOPY|nr:UDP-glucuronosyltransferase 2B7-like [Photinus pyralis]KAB0790863.1 hypothetical protein PPYR_14950 [Photinus pyralis]
MLLLVKLSLLIGVASAARILGVVLTPGYSHQAFFKPFWRELSLRGHQVTTITTHPIKDAKLVNLTEIDLGTFADDTQGHMHKIVELGDTNLARQVRYMFTNALPTVDKLLGFPPVRELIDDKDARFDLVILEHLWNSILPFAVRFNCPYIGMLTIDAPNAMLKKVGNPIHSSLFPDNLLPFGDGPTLTERVSSFLYELGYNNVYLEMEELEKELVEKHFGSDYPPIREMAENISLLFVNADPIFHHNRPLVPAVVQIGGDGFHRSPPRPLPQDIQLVLDAATGGFIYFSLGTNVRSEFLGEKTIDMMLGVFAELPFTVLWKFGGNISRKPRNVVVAKWLPQEDVLRHPNIKLFITQGGQQSMDEAIQSHVPMLGIPFFGDQPFNVRKMVNRGFGLGLNYKNLERESFRQAIVEVIGNSKYRNTVTKLAQLARDQPMSGLEKAIWWTEYVIRHKGAKHLRSPLLDLPWYQYLLLDVIGALLLGLSLSLLTIAFVCRSLIRLVRKKSTSSEKKSS